MRTAGRITRIVFLMAFFFAFGCAHHEMPPTVPNEAPASPSPPPAPVVELPAPAPPPPPPAAEIESLEVRAHLSESGKLKKEETFSKDVYYGTTRVDKCTDGAPKSHKDRYGNFAKAECDELERYDTGNETTSKNIRYGYVTVNIPVVKKIGETKGMNIEAISSDIGWQKFKQSLAKNDMLIYVHGFNTSFNDAAIRCAQLAYDLNYKGKPVFFSWPSNGGIFGEFDYDEDKDRAEENIVYLADFLTKIAASTNKKIHIVAHSMGAYILTHALAKINNDVQKNPLLLTDRIKKNKGKIFNQVVFAAPDIANDEFKEIFTEYGVKNIAQGYTLYSIRNDAALRASRIFNNFIEKNGKTRLGDSSLDYFSIDGMDTIDASNEVVAQIFGHSYYAEDKRMVADLFLLFNYESKPGNRMLLGVEDVTDRHFWFLRP